MAPAPSSCPEILCGGEFAPRRKEGAQSPLARLGLAARGGMVAACLTLAGCAGVPGDLPERRTDPAAALPPMQFFGTPQPMRAERPNSEIARDIMELGFFMESGRPIPVLSRFEGPVTLRTAGPVPATAPRDLERLLARLRGEAGLDIRMAQDQTARANINVEFVPKAQMRALVPQAACFIVPRIASWAEFATHRRSARLDWTTLVVREEVAVFVPADSTPQEIRDCLQEEVAQAMGPLNDLYRLVDSVFNDDNFQTTLTGFDMLVLRAWNAPELRSGMTPQEVAQRLPAILARLNPAGQRTTGQAVRRSPRAWIDAVEAALGGSGSHSSRRAAARRTLAIAEAEGWQGARRAFSLFLTARFARPDEGEAALAALVEAGQIYHRLPGGAVHAAHIDMHMAVQALGTGQYDAVLTLTERARPAAARSENAALLASLMLLRAEALERSGRVAEARAVRLDSLGWARYGFGSDAAVRARAAEIAEIATLAERQARR